MARPKKQSSRKRGRLRIDAFDEEVELLDRAAKKAGMKRSEYVRNCAVITLGKIPQSDAIFILARCDASLQVIHRCPNLTAAQQTILSRTLTDVSDACRKIGRKILE